MTYFADCIIQDSGPIASCEQRLAHQIESGLAVYDVDGVRLGAIDDYDANRWLMIMDSRFFSPVYRVVPFSAIGRVNRGTQSVHLTVQEGALQRTHGLVGEWLAPDVSAVPH
jgi:hypothetical protein